MLPYMQTHGWTANIECRGIIFYGSMERRKRL